ARLRGEAAESQALHLPFQRLDVVRMAVADAADADAGDEVDVLVAVLIVEHRAGPSRHGHPRVLGEGLKPRRQGAWLLLDAPARPRTGLPGWHPPPPRKRSVK